MKPDTEAPKVEGADGLDIPPEGVDVQAALASAIQKVRRMFPYSPGIDVWTQLLCLCGQARETPASPLARARTEDVIIAMRTAGYTVCTRADMTAAEVMLDTRTGYRISMQPSKGSGPEPIEAFEEEAETRMAAALVVTKSVTPFTLPWHIQLCGQIHDAYRELRGDLERHDEHLDPVLKKEALSHAMNALGINVIEEKDEEKKSMNITFEVGDCAIYVVDDDGTLDLQKSWWSRDVTDTERLWWTMLDIPEKS
jgi:hypothetical protein